MVLSHGGRPWGEQLADGDCSTGSECHQLYWLPSMSECHHLGWLPSTATMQSWHGVLVLLEGCRRTGAS